MTTRGACAIRRLQRPTPRIASWRSDHALKPPRKPDARTLKEGSYVIEKRFIHEFGTEWTRAIGPALTIAPNGDWLCHWVAGPSGGLGDGQPGLSGVYKRSTDGG